MPALISTRSDFDDMVSMVDRTLDRAGLHLPGVRTISPGKQSNIALRHVSTDRLDLESRYPASSRSSRGSKPAPREPSSRAWRREGNTILGRYSIQTWPAEGLERHMSAHFQGWTGRFLVSNHGHRRDRHDCRVPDAIRSEREPG